MSIFENIGLLEKDRDRIKDNIYKDKNKIKYYISKAKYYKKNIKNLDYNGSGIWNSVGSQIGMKKNKKTVLKNKLYNHIAKKSYILSSTSFIGIK